MKFTYILKSRALVVHPAHGILKDGDENDNIWSRTEYRRNYMPVISTAQVCSPVRTGEQKDYAPNPRHFHIC